MTFEGVVGNDVFVYYKLEVLTDSFSSGRRLTQEKHCNEPDFHDVAVHSVVNPCRSVERKQNTLFYLVSLIPMYELALVIQFEDNQYKGMSKYSTSVVLIARSKEKITRYLTALKLNISDLFGDNERTQTNKKRLTFKGKKTLEINPAVKSYRTPLHIQRCIHTFSDLINLFFFKNRFF